MKVFYFRVKFNNDCHALMCPCDGTKKAIVLLANQEGSASKCYPRVKKLIWPWRAKTTKHNTNNVINESMGIN